MITIENISKTIAKSTEDRDKLKIEIDTMQAQLDKLRDKNTNKHDARMRKSKKDHKEKMEYIKSEIIKLQRDLKARIANIQKHPEKYEILKD